MVRNNPLGLIVIDWEAPNKTLPRNSIVW